MRVEAPERELEPLSRRTLARPATKLKVPHFVQTCIVYTPGIIVYLILLFAKKKNRYVPW